MSGARYAIYFAPAAPSAWQAFGARWLGRDERDTRAVPQEPPPGFTAGEFAQLTAEPRRYGFHATLKAPMRLREGATLQDLQERLRELATRLRAVPLGQLVPVFMDGFVALVPAQRHPGVDALAALCVTALDDLRAPLTADEIARRNPDRLDERGRQLLAEFGYPHVLERFRFHLTLSGPVDATTAGRLVAHVAPRVARLHTDEAPVLDRLCIFEEPAPGMPFLRVHDEPLAP
jgi:putative phosphonate metabolism protein